jgi:tRNA(His) guanylyltransferase
VHRSPGHHRRTALTHAPRAQVDTHVNNQYNTCFWALRHAGASAADAQAALRGTLADAKNELLFARFGTNYNELPARFRKGSVVVWVARDEVVKAHGDGGDVVRTRRRPEVQHVDIIGDAFWAEHPEVLA